LVLSGGGATGVAHLGVIKALEEHEIPIDYITGTSAGALVGSLYSCGYSIEEIEALILSEDFQVMINGDLHPHQEFLFREDDPDSDMIGIWLSQKNLLAKSLPTNLRSSTYLDLEMMKILGVTSATYGDDFDSLFVPFRCIASNIVTKKSVDLSNGPLNSAVRTSMSYPFLFKPIKLNDTLMFDGGLYDNFPSKTMIKDFNPDFIIGSNVSSNSNPPHEDDIISQLTNMFMEQQNFSLPKDKGYVIQPVTTVGTFEFKSVEQAIKDGYDQTISQIDSIKQKIKGRRTKEELKAKRAKFRSKIPDFIITDIQTSSDKKKIVYSSRSMLKENKVRQLNLSQFEKRYYRLNAASQINFMYPTVSMNDDSTFKMEINVKKEREIRIEAGGLFSSRPINTGYVGLSYQSIGKILTKTKLTSYFGKFYGAFSAKFSIEIPSSIPFSVNSFFTLNRWDYFRSFATFFEDAQPSFLVQEEIYGGISIDHPMGNSIKSSWEFKGFSTKDSYYQTDQFTNKDTTDITSFSGGTVTWKFLQNTLNRKQFANSGRSIRVNSKFVYGREHSTGGSTSSSPIDLIKNHMWLNVNASYEDYLLDYPLFHLGIRADAVANTMPEFATYTASLLSLDSYSPLVDANTYFLPEYKAPYFMGIGVSSIFTMFKKLDFRLEGYFFQPIVQIIINDDGSQGQSKLFKTKVLWPHHQ